MPSRFADPLPHRSMTGYRKVYTKIKEDPALKDQEEPSKATTVTGAVAGSVAGPGTVTTDGKGPSNVSKTPLVQHKGRKQKAKHASGHNNSTTQQRYVVKAEAAANSSYPDYSGTKATTTLNSNAAANSYRNSSTIPNNYGHNNQQNSHHNNNNNFNNYGAPQAASISKTATKISTGTGTTKSNSTHHGPGPTNTISHNINTNNTTTNSTLSQQNPAHRSHCASALSQSEKCISRAISHILRKKRGQWLSLEELLERVGKKIGPDSEVELNLIRNTGDLLGLMQKSNDLGKERWEISRLQAGAQGPDRVLLTESTTNPMNVQVRALAKVLDSHNTSSLLVSEVDPKVIFKAGGEVVLESSHSSRSLLGPITNHIKSSHSSRSLLPGSCTLTTSTTGLYGPSSATTTNYDGSVSVSDSVQHCPNNHNLTAEESVSVSFDESHEERVLTLSGEGGGVTVGLSLIHI